VVNVDNVGSNQMHQIRVALRGKGIVVMGKNTMVRRALRSILSENPQFERLLPHVRGNIGFVFTSGDLKDVRDLIIENKVAAPARAGAFAPRDVIVPAGNTGMEPGKTSFFQALGIPTKIARGTIEIVSDVKVVVAGTRVGPSEAALLNMLNISPFTYGMTVVQIFDSGNAFTPDVLDVTDTELVDRFLSGIKTIAAISLALSYPTIVSVSHSLVNAYKNLIAVSIATDYTFEGSEKAKEYLANPEAFAVAAAPAAATEETTTAPAEEEKKEDEEDEDEDMVRLFRSISDEYNLNFPTSLGLWVVRLDCCLYCCTAFIFTQKRAVQSVCVECVKSCARNGSIFEGGREGWSELTVLLIGAGASLLAENSRLDSSAHPPPLDRGARSARNEADDEHLPHATFPDHDHLLRDLELSKQHVPVQESSEPEC
jgi:large subunit ribosomal protein LP0